MMTWSDSYDWLNLKILRVRGRKLEKALPARSASSSERPGSSCRCPRNPGLRRSCCCRCQQGCEQREKRRMHSPCGYFRITSIDHFIGFLCVQKSKDAENREKMLLLGRFVLFVAITSSGCTTKHAQSLLTLRKIGAVAETSFFGGLPPRFFAFVFAAVLMWSMMSLYL